MRRALPETAGRDDEERLQRAALRAAPVEGEAGIRRARMRQAGDRGHDIARQQHAAPVLRVQRRLRGRDLVRGCGSPVQSLAMLPLRIGADPATFGLLVLGSADKDRFQIDMGTDLPRAHRRTGERRAGATARLMQSRAAGAHVRRRGALTRSLTASGDRGFLDDLGRQRRASPHTLAAYRRDLAKLAQLAAGRGPARAALRTRSAASSPGCTPAACRRRRWRARCRRGALTSPG